MIQKTRWSQYIRSHKKNLHSRDEKFFHGYIYITPMLLLWDLSTLYVVEHLLLLTLRSLFSLLNTIWIIWLFGSLVPAMHTLHHGSKCMSCHEAIVVIIRRAYCFHDYIYITLILLPWIFRTLCGIDLIMIPYKSFVG